MRTAIALALTVVPIVGLATLVAAVIYYPEELAEVVRTLLAREDVSGLEDADLPAGLEDADLPAASTVA